MKRGQKVRALCLHKGKVVVSFDNSLFLLQTCIKSKKGKITMTIHVPFDQNAERNGRKNMYILVQ